MSTPAIVGIVILVIVVVIVAATAARIIIQRRALRERYGDEYDRVVTEKGGRTAAQAELRRRERQHAQLQLQDLSPEARARYQSAWTDLQGQFIDDPKTAVHAADELVSQLVAERGYPVVDFPDRLAHLSVEHASVLNRYRDGHDISVRNDAGTATTEELRQSLVNYRELIADLLGDPSLMDGPTAPATTDTTAPPEVDPAADGDATVASSLDPAAEPAIVTGNPGAAPVPAPATPPELRNQTDDLPEGSDMGTDPLRTPAARAPEDT